LRTHLEAPELREELMKDLESKVLAEVEKVVDLETGLTFGQMEMVQSVKEIQPGVVRIDFTLSSPICTDATKMAIEVKSRAENIEGVKKALVYCHGHIIEEEINQTVNK